MVNILQKLISKLFPKPKSTNIDQIKQKNKQKAQHYLEAKKQFRKMHEETYKVALRDWPKAKKNLPTEVKLEY